ncbi:PREDICTED: cytokine-dependent hematopoietic cell linker, partial [Buceros rhinoceros silvestris]|uniref:cytokine-dependent hematopoietic cell linker n=1 Tax=Buceros rhinoceros silvestris TaxID=175836 RepID=UPI000529098E
NEDFARKSKSDLQPSSKVSEEHEDVYEVVNTSTLEAIHALRILPAKPLQESEYADKRCLRPSGTTSPKNSQCTSQFPQHSADPVPPPRPLKTLPKEYQPLPPEPQISSQFFHTRKTISQAHTFPISAKVTSLLHTQSSKNIGGTVSVLNAENLSAQRSPSPMPYTACKNKSKHSLVKREMQPLTQPTEKDLNKYEWYIGEYDRHEAEKALFQENTDETFLVRDCSKKSNAEPYVLVVYYRRRVYNIKVRFLEESQQYALGSGLRGDDKFNSVKEIIDFYKYVPITLIDGKDKSGIQREQCFLTYPFKMHKRRLLP